MITCKLLALAILCACTAGDPPVPAAATDADAKQVLVEMRVIQIDAPVRTLTFEGGVVLLPQPGGPSKSPTKVQTPIKPTDSGGQKATGASEGADDRGLRLTADVVRLDGTDSKFGVALVSEGATIRADQMTFRLAGGELQPTAAPGAPLPLDWQTIAAPRLLTLLGQEATIEIGATVPYLVLRADGCLVVEESEDVREGMKLGVKIDRADAERISFGSVDLKISSIIDRQTLPGVPFDLGRPVIRTVSTPSRFSMAPDEVAIIVFPAQSDDHTAILVLLRASVASDTGE